MNSSSTTTCCDDHDHEKENENAAQTVAGGEQEEEEQEEHETAATNEDDDDVTAPLPPPPTKKLKRSVRPLPNFLQRLSLETLGEYEITIRKEEIVKQAEGDPQQQEQQAETNTTTATTATTSGKEEDHALTIQWSSSLSLGDRNEHENGKGNSNEKERVFVQDLRKLTIDQLRKLAQQICVRKSNLTKQQARYWIAQTAKMRPNGRVTVATTNNTNIIITTTTTATPASTETTTAKMAVPKTATPKRRQPHSTRLGAPTTLEATAHSRTTTTTKGALASAATNTKNTRTLQPTLQQKQTAKPDQSSSSSSSLLLACQKLSTPRLCTIPPFPVEDLPKDRTDPLWTEIFKQYFLSLPELSALKNHACAVARSDTTTTSTPDRSLSTRRTTTNGHNVQPPEVGSASVATKGRNSQNHEDNKSSPPTKFKPPVMCLVSLLLRHNENMGDSDYRPLVFEAAQKHFAHYSKARGIRISYPPDGGGSDLEVRCYFWTTERAMSFIQELFKVSQGRFQVLPPSSTMTTTTTTASRESSVSSSPYTLLRLTEDDQPPKDLDIILKTQCTGRK